MTQKTPTKILIVDDEPYIRDILFRWLVNEGYHCFTAANVDKAWKLLTRKNIALILLDIMLPEQPGTVILHRVREKYPDVAVVMVTGLDRRGMAAETLHLGAYTYITKPFDRNEIVIEITRALQHREERLQRASLSVALGGEEIRELKSSQVKRRPPGL